MHRAESITAAVVTNVTGLTTTGTNVVRGRVFPTGVSALSVDMGPERPVALSNVVSQDVLLDIDITALAKATTTTVDTVLNQIAAEVHAALMADTTQGLAYVQKTTWTVRQAMQRDADTTIGRQTTTYTIQYRRSYTSAEL